MSFRGTLHMHGLVNRSIQCFLRDTYGLQSWLAVADAAGVGPQGFEAMLHYDDAVTDVTLDAAARVLTKPRDALLEDIGTYLVQREALRRLLRFAGADYVEFLHSLEEMPDRIRLAIPELVLPELVLREPAPGQFRVLCRGGRGAYVGVIVGALRAMADDYGALAVIDLARPGGSEISVDLLDSHYAEGRRFDLAHPVAG